MASFGVAGPGVVNYTPTTLGVADRASAIVTSTVGDTGVVAQNWGPLALFSQPYPGGAGFYGDPGRASDLFLTSAGEANVSAPGDPIGLFERQAGSFNWSQPTSAARPVWARFPRGGIRNNVPSSVAVSSTPGILSTTTVESFDGSNTAQLFHTTTAAELHRVIRVLSLNQSATTSRLAGVRVKIPAGSDVSRLYLRVRSATSGRGFWCTVSSGVIAYASGINAFGPNAPAQPTEADIRVYALGDGWYYLGIYGPCSSLSSEVFTQIDVGISAGTAETSAATANTTAIITGWSLEDSSEPGSYQQVYSPTDIREPGQPSVYLPYYSGSQWMDSGVQSFGNASLFASAGQEWTTISLFRTLSTNAVAILGRQGATDAIGTFSVFKGSLGGGLGRCNVRCRGLAVGSIPAGDVGDGRLHLAITRWNGSSGDFWVDGFSPVALSVGTEAEETGQNIISGARNNGASLRYDGHLHNMVIDRALTNSEVDQVRTWAANTYGVQM